MGWIRDLLAKTFRLGPAAVEPVDVAFGRDPEVFSPPVYGDYIATSSAVYACANLCARNLASLPLYVYRDGEVVEDGALVELLKKVNPHWTFNRLMQMTELSLRLWGQAFWVLERGPNGDGVPSEIWWARPDRMRLIPDERNYLAGWFYEYQAQRLAFKPAEVIWFRYPNPIDEFAGLSPIAATRLAIDTGHAALRSNHSIFSNGVQLAGVVTPADKDQTWQRDQVEALREMLERRFKGADKAHRLAVLGQPATFTPMGVSPKDAQFIELMRWTRTDVAMVMGVPPELIGDQEGSTYNNVREAHKALWTDNLIPEATMIATEITEQLVPMFDGEADRVEFDLSGVLALQQDMKDTAEQAKLWASIGVPLNAILKELAPQFLDDGEGYEWGDQPANVQATPEVRAVKFAQYPGLRFIAPTQVRRAARKGLELYNLGRGGDGLVASTIREARDMAGRRDVTPDKLRRMRAWFARHESDKRPGWDAEGKETPGYVAWLLWGGDPGRRWAEEMVAAMDRIDAQDGRKADAGIPLGSPQHKAAYEQFGARADRVMASMRRTVTGLFERQRDELSRKLAEEAAKAIEQPDDLEAIWDEEYWQAIFADALLDQIQIAAELGAISTLGQLEVSTANFDLEAPEVQAFIRSRSQRFAEEVNQTTWDNLRTSLAEGIADGESILQLEERVAEVMGDRIRSSVETIARTETIGALNGGSLLGAEASGLELNKAWLATFDGRERDSHAEAHRRYQARPIPLRETFNVGGVALRGPGDAVGGRSRASAAEVINCRCTLTYQKALNDTGERSVLTSEIARWINDSR